MERVRTPATIARIGKSARENKLRRYPMESSLETWKCKYDIIPLNARGFMHLRELYALKSKGQHCGDGERRDQLIGKFALFNMNRVSWIYPRLWE